LGQASFEQYVTMAALRSGSTSAARAVTSPGASGTAPGRCCFAQYSPPSASTTVTSPASMALRSSSREISAVISGTPS